MNKIVKKFIYILGLTAAIFVAGCSDDIDPEITSLEVSRLFSPVDLETLVVNQTGVRLEWNKVNKADSYSFEFFENGDEDFTGTALRTISGITYDEVPYVVSGFDGETDYSVRIKAVGEGISDSKWISTTFSTDPEQIFYNVDAEEITAFTVILRWPAGEVATSIVLTPGDITHTITTDDIAVGIVEFTGLTSETQYTAKLMNGTKTRGTITFTTAIDIGDAILVKPEDDLKALVEAANEGESFALMPGEYEIAGDININTTVSIVGVRSYDKPIINGAVFRMKAGAGLRLKDVVMDGTTNPDGNQAIVYDDASDAYGALSIIDCLVKNYVKGTLYVNVAALIESVTISGTIYSEIECNGGDFIDFRAGMAKTFDFFNNTVYNSALARDFFRMDSGGSTNFPAETSIITIANNTFHNIISESTSKRILYIRLASHEITVNKNIFSGTTAGYSNQSATTVVAMADNNYFNAPNLISSSFTVYDAGSYTTLDPGFTDPDNGDFTVTNEDLLIYGIGDPRWLQ